MARSRRISFFQRKLLLKAGLITGLLLAVFIPVLNLIPWNFSLFDPVQEVLQDFSYTDQYYAKFNTRRAPAPNIVLVNIGGRDYQTRSQLAAVLRALRPYAPKVIGLDAYFEPRTDTATAGLLAAMQELPQLVTSVALDSTAAGWRTTTSTQGLGPRAT